jgi:hypothetical protein
MNVLCHYCGACHWIQERLTRSTVASPIFMTCCKEGEIELPVYSPLPKYLRDLLHCNNLRGWQFRENLHAYNSALAFTSVDCTPIDRGVGLGGVQVF